MQIIIIIWTYSLHYYCVTVIVIITDALTCAQHSSEVCSSCQITVVVRLETMKLHKTEQYIQYSTGCSKSKYYKVKWPFGPPKNLILIKIQNANQKSHCCTMGLCCKQENERNACLFCSNKKKQRPTQVHHGPTPNKILTRKN